MQPPLLKREDIQQVGRKLYSRALPTGHGATEAIVTSGSTGKPVELLGTSLTNTFWNAFTVRDFLWRRCDLSGKLATIRYDRSGTASYPDGADLPDWGHAPQTGHGIDIFLALGVGDIHALGGRDDCRPAFVMILERCVGVQKTLLVHLLEGEVMGRLDAHSGLLLPPAPALGANLAPRHWSVITPLRRVYGATIADLAARCQLDFKHRTMPR